jgi:Fe-S-cluster containining protein
VKLSTADRARGSLAMFLSRIAVNSPLAYKNARAPRPQSPAERLSQPCPAWVNGRCAIYKARPDHCRNFDCALLQKVLSSRTTPEQALRVINDCKRKADKVRNLLRESGDTNEHLPLMTRFRRTLRRYEAGDCDAAAGARLSRLTIAAHRLNRALARHIYP